MGKSACWSCVMLGKPQSMLITSLGQTFQAMLSLILQGIGISDIQRVRALLKVLWGGKDFCFLWWDQHQERWRDDQEQLSTYCGRDARKNSSAGPSEDSQPQEHQALHFGRVWQDAWTTRWVICPYFHICTWLLLTIDQLLDKIYALAFVIYTVYVSFSVFFFCFVLMSLSNSTWLSSWIGLHEALVMWFGA